MRTSKTGFDLIKKFEGCSLKAYQDAVGVWTIGYGVTSADKSVTGHKITKGMTISQSTADQWLEECIRQIYEPKVNKYSKYNFSQSEYDALVSFCFNVGSIDQLTAHGTRSKVEIGQKMLLYVKAGGKVLEGLKRRRQAEYKLYTEKQGYTGKFPNLPSRGYFKLGDGIDQLRGKQTDIKRVQRVVNWVMDFSLEVDGMYGAKTQKAVKKMQTRFGLDANGSYGAKCQKKAKAFRK
jgi:GH24 family phage-related lysozyme (muramidase)